jgi:hypothetical protein
MRGVLLLLNVNRAVHFGQAKTGDTDALVGSSKFPVGR